MLVRGDNLDVMRRLRATHAGAFRCAYVDPPYNTGRTFNDEYVDAWEPEAWRAMMRPRLEAIAPLVAGDGAVVCEIDDTQLGDLLALLDDTFGRENRVAVVTVVRSAPTGHKAINRGPVNVADYLLVYAKERSAWRPNALVRRRPTRDRAYATFLSGREGPPDAWRFEPLSRAVARSLGHASRVAAVAALGREAFERETFSFSLAHAEDVVRFAQPRYEAVSVEARALIDRSRADPERVFVLARRGHKAIVLRGGNRVLFLADKVRAGSGGKRELVEPLTNVWDDVPFQGIAREGGVRFTRNKKPERLLERVIELTTRPGDAVLDPFAGSGTTAAVALKTGRAFVAIESTRALDELCAPRLARVVAGEDPTGITRARAWTGGGGFGVYA